MSLLLVNHVPEETNMYSKSVYLSFGEFMFFDEPVCLVILYRDLVANISF